MERRSPRQCRQAVGDKAEETTDHTGTKRRCWKVGTPLSAPDTCLKANQKSSPGAMKGREITSETRKIVLEKKLANIPILTELKF